MPGLSLFARVKRAAAAARLNELGVAGESCALCGFPFLVRLADSGLAVRCPACGASAITQSLVDVLTRQTLRLDQCKVYELSAQGPLVRFLRRHARELVTSEFLDGVPPGAVQHGILCQDVQRLTFGEASFDVCTSTEVFEHVPDDRAGFAEVLRVLRPGGLMVFSVPLDPARDTVERAATGPGGERIDLLPPEYHGDRLRGDTIFTWRNYGRDIVQRLQGAGFASAGIEWPRRKLFGHAQPIVIARKAASEEEG